MAMQTKQKMEVLKRTAADATTLIEWLVQEIDGEDDNEIACAEKELYHVRKKLINMLDEIGGIYYSEIEHALDETAKNH